MTLKTRIAHLETIAPVTNSERVTTIERWIVGMDGKSTWLAQSRDVGKALTQYFDEAGNVTSVISR